MADDASSSAQPTPGPPVAVMRNGSWYEPNDSLFGPELFTGPMPACGMLTGNSIHTLPPPDPYQMRADRMRSDRPTLLPTPDRYQGRRGGPTRPDRRRARRHTVSLDDVVAYL